MIIWLVEMCNIILLLFSDWRRACVFLRRHFNYVLLSAKRKQRTKMNKLRSFNVKI